MTDCRNLFIVQLLCHEIRAESLTLFILLKSDSIHHVHSIFYYALVLQSVGDFHMLTGA